MMATSETERMRRCRRVFERAMQDNCTMREARQRLAEDDWRDAMHPSQTARCGTAAVETDEEGEARLQWWQR